MFKIKHLLVRYDLYHLIVDSAKPRQLIFFYKNFVIKSFMKVDQDHTSKGSLFKTILYFVTEIVQASVCGVVLTKPLLICKQYLIFVQKYLSLVMDNSFYYFLNQWEKGDGSVIFWLCFCFLFVEWFKFCYFTIVRKRGQ